MNKYNFDKIELHLHLDGAFRFSTIWELALRENVKMPKDTLEEYIEYIRYSANCGSPVFRVSHHNFLEVAF